MLTLKCNLNIKQIILVVNEKPIRVWLFCLHNLNCELHHFKVTCIFFSFSMPFLNGFWAILSWSRPSRSTPGPGPSPRWRRTSLDWSTSDRATASTRGTRNSWTHSWVSRKTFSGADGNKNFDLIFSSSKKAFTNSI